MFVPKAPLFSPSSTPKHRKTSKVSADPIEIKITNEPGRSVKSPMLSRLVAKT